MLGRRSTSSPACHISSSFAAVCSAKKPSQQWRGAGNGYGRNYDAVTAPGSNVASIIYFALVAWLCILLILMWVLAR
jgi:hypothetical protein